MRQEDLVYVYCDGSGKGLYVDAKLPRGIKLDLAAGTWSDGPFTAKIGTQYRMPEWSQRANGFLVGIYDRTSTGHLGCMLYVQREAAKEAVSVLHYASR